MFAAFESTTTGDIGDIQELEATGVPILVAAGRRGDALSHRHCSRLLGLEDDTHHPPTVPTQSDQHVDQG